MAIKILNKEQINWYSRDENGQTILQICLMKNLPDLFLHIVNIIEYNNLIQQNTEDLYQILNQICQQGIGLQHIAAYRDQVQILDCLRVKGIDL